MPRPRKHNPTIPAHIDQPRIPKGVYWDSSGNGRWYVLEFPRKAVTVASSKALLSDLHAIMEARAGTAARGTVGYVMDRFHESTKFAELSAGTRKGYEHQRQVVRTYKTGLGLTLDKLAVSRLSVPAIQRIVELIAKGRGEVRGMPSKANHLLRYLSRVFAWGVQHGACQNNPASGAAQVKERGQFKMPTPETFSKVAHFAVARGERKAHTEGSVAPYLGHLMIIAYACRLRGIEAVTLTDANATDDGVLSNRRKGSRDNVTRWTPELRDAWDALVKLRKDAEKRHDRPAQLRPELRYLVVSQRGTPLSKSALDTAWQRLMALAMKPDEDGVSLLQESEHFTLHGIKHRGITDSKDKASGGHKSERMRQRYDHEVPLVEPAKLPSFSGVFSGGNKKGV